MAFSCFAQGPSWLHLLCQRFTTSRHLSWVTPSKVLTFVSSVRLAMTLSNPYHNCASPFTQSGFSLHLPCVSCFLLAFASQYFNLQHDQLLLTPDFDGYSSLGACLTGEVSLGTGSRGQSGTANSSSGKKRSMLSLLSITGNCIVTLGPIRETSESRRSLFSAVNRKHEAFLSKWLWSRTWASYQVTYEERLWRLLYSDCNINARLYESKAVKWLVFDNTF